VAAAHDQEPPSVCGDGCDHCGHTGLAGRQVLSRWQAHPPGASREGDPRLADTVHDWVVTGLVSREEARRVGALAV
jgi:hypothetical protein